MIKVFMTGTFDVLHRGHIEVLKYAKNLGDTLTVAVDTDARVRSLKGSSRPFHNEDDRVFVLSSISYVNDIVTFGSDEELIQHLKRIKPHILVAGSDWKDKPGVGREYAEQVVFFDRIQPYSTTSILKREDWQ
jgi:D-beta-D-heptose 7-phosphate kinase/D-beta-D-heptose 1-phosphate adenosyltransferase